MEWPAVLGLIVALAFGWAIRGRFRRGEPDDENYNGAGAADPALMEAGRQHHGRLW